MKSKGKNFQVLSTEGLIKKLKEYDKEMGIDMFHVYETSIGFTLKSPPSDLMAFAEDVLTFCPSIEDTETLISLFNETGVIGLWWD